MQSDSAIAESLKKVESLPEGAARKKEVDQLEGLVNRREVLGKPVASDDVSNLARSAKKNPLYTDREEGQKANWLGKSMEKIGKLLERRSNRQPRFNPASAPDVTWVGTLLQVFAWGVLAALVVFFAYLIAKHVRWKQTLQRKARAVLEEDEPERTLDEWLALADEHEKAGRYREAVRCLYLACLLKFDEGNVARFDRGQTNWEHLARIEASPNLPPGIEFRSATRHFDLVWYGHIVKGFEDVAAFRAAYLSIRDNVGRRRAA